jgi:hypothetical protein
MKIIKLLNEIASGTLSYTDLSNKDKVRLRSITLGEMAKKKEIVPLTDEKSIKSWMKKHGYSNFTVDKYLNVILNEEFYYPKNSDEMNAVSIVKANSLIISYTDAEKIDMSNFEVEFGKVSIQNSTNLKSLILPSATRGGLYITLVGCPNLETISNSHKQNINDFIINASGNISHDVNLIKDGKIFNLILNRTQISSLDEIGGRDVVTVTLNDCNGLREIGNIDNKIESVTIIGDGIKDLNMSGGEKLYTLTIKECDSLVSLKGVKDVRNLTLYQCNGIEDLTGLENAQIEYLSLEWCKNLSSLYGVQNNNKIENITIELCQKLQHLKHMNPNSNIQLKGQTLKSYKGIKLNKKNGVGFLYTLFHHGVSTSLTDINFGDCYDEIQNSKYIPQILKDYVRFCEKGFTDSEISEYIKMLKKELTTESPNYDNPQWILNKHLYNNFLSDLENSI